jgi:hypothetical protein
MRKIIFTFLILFPLYGFSQSKIDLLGTWKVDKIQFEINDSLLSETQKNELAEKYESFYFEQEKNTSFIFLKNNRIAIEQEDVQEGTFEVEDDKLFIYSTKNQIKSTYFFKWYSPIYMELKTLTEKTNYIIFLKKIAS